MTGTISNTRTITSFIVGGTGGTGRTGTYNTTVAGFNSTTNTIDVLSYDCDDKEFEDEIIQYSTKPKENINDELSIVVSSKFPYGYSENYLRATYNHLKEISCKCQPYFKFSWVELTCKLIKTDFEITSIKSDSYYPSNKLLSILKDNYNGSTDTVLSEDNIFLTVI